MGTETLTLQEICGAASERDGCIRIAFADGYTGVVDLNPLIRKGGIFARLADPELFRRVEIGLGGRYLQWPGGIDLCADALRIKAETKEANAR